MVSDDAVLCDGAVHDAGGIIVATTSDLNWFMAGRVLSGIGGVVINVLMTVRSRQEPILFVSVWYTTAAIVLTSITYCLGNVSSWVVPY